MNHHPIVLLRSGITAALMLILCGGAALAQQNPGVQDSAKDQPRAASSPPLDRMIAAGKSTRELAQYIFDTHACRDCHTIGQEGKLGLTKRGEQRAQGFEGCVSTLKAMSIIAKVPVNQRSATQRQRAERFQEFGCATCHKLTPGKMGMTEVGAKLANLHLGCVEVEKLLSGNAGSQP